MAQPDPAVVRVEQGLIRGARSGDTWNFRGIPYGAAPVGDRRFRAPEPAGSWEGERDATAFGEPCVQVDPQRRKVIGNEDCLTLNVWTPAERPIEQPIPVIVFLHGGDNRAGSATGKTFDGVYPNGIYDGQFLATRGPAVFVTLNYRVGPLGWLAHPALRDSHGVAGNYGLHDQIEALHWVSRNAAAFGGDPSRVMLFGQSAGAVDTCSIVASPLAAGLVSRAVMQSGPCFTYDAGPPADEALRFLKCGEGDIAACLRGKTAEEIAHVPGASLVDSSDVHYGPVVDGWALPAEPVRLMERGKHNHMPLVFGTNADEYTTNLGYYATESIDTDAAYVSIVQRTLGEGLAVETLKRYPSKDYPTPKDALVAILGDWLMHCPTRRGARAARVGQTEPVFRYLYAHTIEQASHTAFRAGHGLELAFVFGDFHEFAASQRERRLSNDMMDAWLRVAASGDPNANGASTWPVYDGPSDTHVILDEPARQGAGLHAALCDFWDGID